MLACVFLILKPRQSGKQSSRNGCISQWRTNLSWAAFSQSNHVEHKPRLKQQNFSRNTFRLKGCDWRFERPQSSSSNLFLCTLIFVKLNTKFVKSWPLFYWRIGLREVMRGPFFESRFWARIFICPLTASVSTERLKVQFGKYRKLSFTKKWADEVASVASRFVLTQCCAQFLIASSFSFFLRKTRLHCGS